MSDFVGKALRLTATGYILGFAGAATASAVVIVWLTRPFFAYLFVVAAIYLVLTLWEDWQRGRRS